jgi:SAM-dependent methyltransferase
MNTNKTKESTDEIKRALAGELIYGDNHNLNKIKKWFHEEEDAYANLGSEDRDSYLYKYDALNQLHGFSYISKGRVFEKVLGYGSAYGDELKPVLSAIRFITIIESSEKLKLNSIGGKPAIWVKPETSGTFSFSDRSFDLITCFGVLHHVPNVTYIISELARVLQNGGILMIREPIVSMGDWRYPRPGLTINERGIPLYPFRKAITLAGLRVVRTRFCGFGPLLAILKRLNVNVYQSRFWTCVDWILSEMFSWNTTYHAPKGSLLKKFRPTSIFIVLTR